MIKAFLIIVIGICVFWGSVALADGSFTTAQTITSPETKQTISLINNLDRDTLEEYERMFIIYQKALRFNGQMQAHGMMRAPICRIDIGKKIKKAWKPIISTKSYTTRVSFNLNDKGCPEDIKIVRSSGDEIQDEAALKSLKAAAPFLTPLCAPQKVFFDYEFRVKRIKNDELVDKALKESKPNSGKINLNTLCEEVLHGADPLKEETFLALIQVLKENRVSFNNPKELFQFGSSQLEKGNLTVAITILGLAIKQNEDPALTEPISKKLLSAINRKVVELSDKFNRKDY